MVPLLNSVSNKSNKRQFERQDKSYELILEYDFCKDSGIKISRSNDALSELCSIKIDDMKIYDLKYNQHIKIEYGLEKTPLGSTNSILGILSLEK